MTGTVTITLTVNGTEVTETIPARLNLADFLRDTLGLTGTHLGCEHGVCGACSVLMNGASVRACLVFAAQAAGRDIWTVEGLHDSGRVADLQDALSRNHGLQCGYCTPGFLVAATEYLDEGGTPDEAAIRESLSGNICRCTGYQGIVTAVAEVAVSRTGHRAPAEG